MTRQSRPHTVPEGYLTASQAGDILHVSGKTITRWAREGKLPFMRTLGGHRRFEERAIREILACNIIPAMTGPGSEDVR